MQRVGEHPVGVGPLAVRWLAYEVEPARAGSDATAHVVLENAGTATWRSRGEAGVQFGYHWLDPLGNPVFWDGARTPLPHPVAPGETIELLALVQAPRPPGSYRLALDLVEEHRFWFSDLGLETLTLDVEVHPRIGERRLAVVVRGGADAETRAALAAQEEPVVDGDAEAVAYLVAGAAPAHDWSRLLLDAHAEGWAAVGPAIEGAGGLLARRQLHGLSAWRSGTGRNPRFDHPLLLPSLLAGLEPTEHAGLPAYEGDGLFDGRIVVRLRPRSGRPPS